jgi:RND superfamily putative drug exporter
MFTALAGLTARPRTVLAAALLFLVGMVVLGGGVSDRLRSGGNEDPGSESAAAAAVLDQKFPASRPNLALLVTPARAGQTVDAAPVAAAGRALAARLAAEPGVVGVTSYWQTGAPSLRASDGGHALVVARIDGDDTTVSTAYERLEPRYAGPQGDLSVQLTGQAAIQHGVRSTVKADLGRAELVVFPVTLVILVLVFGSALAALLPLAVGIMAVLGTNAVLRVLTSVTSVSIFSQNLTTALGLGLAIDYALFVVRRFREELRRGLSPREAVLVTIATAGRTVLFSALTVAVSLAAMLVFPMYFLRSFAYAGISVVLFAALAALVVLPAALVLLGHRVDAWDVRRLWRRRRSAARAPVEPDRSGWGRLAWRVMHAAPAFAIGTVALLVVLGLPFLQVAFGAADDRQLPASAPARAAQQVIRDDFASRPTGVIDVVAGSQGSTVDAIAAFAGRMSTLDGVGQVLSPAGTFARGRQVRPPTPADRTRTADGLSYLSVLPTVEDISPQSQDLVRAIRSTPAPFRVQVAGAAASLVDTENAIGSRLPAALGLITLATLALVFMFTGSLLVPVLVVLLSALSLTAMFGAVVWVFQDGHLSGVLGFTPTGFIETTLPVLMFCLAFGLSMDYGIFLLSRIKERYQRTGDSRASIAFGMARTGGVITAAAATLSVVLVAIGMSRVTNIKMLGLGGALAVLVDATIVRCLLLPAAMSLAGRATWWAPAPLARFQRRFGLHEPAEPVGPTEPAEPAAGSPAAGPAGSPAEPAADPVGTVAVRESV